MRGRWWLLPVLALLLDGWLAAWVLLGYPVPRWMQLAFLALIAGCVLAVWRYRSQAHVAGRTAERWFLAWCEALERRPKSPGR